jgi:hypothetical protein
MDTFMLDSAQRKVTKTETFVGDPCGGPLTLIDLEALILIIKEQSTK